jgi:hypothetical protein
MRALGLVILTLAGLAMAQVATKVPPEKLAKAYRYELVLSPLEESKLPPAAPDADRLRNVFVQKMGILELAPTPVSEAKKAGWTYLLYTESPLPETEIQEILKTAGLKAESIQLLSTLEKPKTD